MPSLHRASAMQRRRQAKEEMLRACEELVASKRIQSIHAIRQKAELVYTQLVSITQ
jgi:hypothetical protein